MPAGLAQRAPWQGDMGNMCSALRCGGLLSVLGPHVLSWVLISRGFVLTFSSAECQPVVLCLPLSPSFLQGREGRTDCELPELSALRSLMETGTEIKGVFYALRMLSRGSVLKLGLKPPTELSKGGPEEGPGACITQTSQGPGWAGSGL